MKIRYAVCVNLDMVLKRFMSLKDTFHIWNPAGCETVNN